MIFYKILLRVYVTEHLEFFDMYEKVFSSGVSRVKWSGYLEGKSDVVCNLNTARPGLSFCFLSAVTFSLK